MTMPTIALPMALSMSKRLYVVPFPSLFGEDGDGSLTHPYTSIQQALDYIERNYYRELGLIQRTSIHLYPTYHFVKTLHMHKVHSHTRLATMNDEDIAFYKQYIPRQYRRQQLPRAVISGGILITNWTNLGDNLYKAIVPSTVFVSQLFVNNERCMRSRVPMNTSLYLYYDAPLPDPNQARYGFQYADGQFDNIYLDDAMVVVYHSWTTSHHYIDQLIQSNRTILFTNPSDRPIGTFAAQGNRRFHIENVCNSLSPNSFCFTNATKTVYLKTDGSYNPSNIPIITPINEFVMVVAGADVNDSIEDIIIENIAIQHGAWNIGRSQQADSQAAAFLDSAALHIANATTIIVTNIEVSHSGSYGIQIREGTFNILIMNSIITDTGAGGIRIGQMNQPIYPTKSIKVLYNEVSYGGNVFPSGVGILTHRANDVDIVGNEIHHHRYTGISIGWEWGYKPSNTSNILVEGNYIHTIGQHILCDQGGIYTLGIQPGTVITGNVIKNVYSYANYMWGIYLDEGTSDIIVSNNVVYNTGWASFFQHYGANNTIINNVFARASLIPPPIPGIESPDGDMHIGLAENHTSASFISNIIYDTYPGPQHSAYKSDPNVIANLHKNVYYNSYGNSLLFGPKQISFTDWQKTGQDNDSMIADPLFIGNVEECDFFTIRSDSPAAQLGFKNITKPWSWTPGCDTDYMNDIKQYYHW